MPILAPKPPLCGLPLLACLLASTSALAQEPVDAEAVEFLRTEGLENSQVMEHLRWICDVHGPRLTSSPNLRRAQEWAAETLRTWGPLEVEFDDWGPFGMGWELERFGARVVGQNAWPVQCFPKAWSTSIEGPSGEQRVIGEVVRASDYSAEEFAAVDLSDKIVLLEDPREVDEWFEGSARRFDVADLHAMATGMPPPNRGQMPSMAFTRGFQMRSARMRVLQENPPLAILDRSYKGDYGTIFVTSASIGSPSGLSRSQRPRPWKPGEYRVIPQFTVSVEHYNRMCRLLEHGHRVRMELELQARFVGDESRMDRNVLAELPGSDPQLRDQVVMLGAHFDSWHSGTGATDNGCGSAVMMEAMRLVTALAEHTGKAPRRTVRLALWSGEEQGLLGSRAWVAEHVATRGGRNEPPTEVFEQHAKISGYFNLDNGTGRVRGVYLEGNEAIAPIFRAWLKPFHDLDAGTLTLSTTGGTDHMAFNSVGVPGFQFIQDPVAYSTRTHHSTMDNQDHAVPEDLQQAATVIASFVWHAAMRDEMLPRKTL